MQYIELGPAPAGEACAQVGSPGYEARAQRECLVFQRMLQRLFPIPASLGVRYLVRRHPHDFGDYLEVSVGYDAGGAAAEAACEFAFSVERCIPERWDAIATYELLWLERSGCTASGDLANLCRLPTLPQTASLQDLLAHHPL